MREQRGRLMAGCAAAVIAMCVCAVGAGAATTANPSALVGRLLDPPSAGPGIWFGIALPHTSPLSDRALSYRALARIVVDSTDAKAEAAWVVFPSRAPAVADLGDAVDGLRRQALVDPSVKRISGFPAPAYLVSGRFRQTGEGITYVLFANGITLTDAWTLGKKGATHGRIARTIALAHWAQRRLSAAQR